MYCVDVNVLVQACVAASPRFAVALSWLLVRRAEPEGLGLFRQMLLEYRLSSVDMTNIYLADAAREVMPFGCHCGVCSSSRMWPMGSETS